MRLHFTRKCYLDGGLEHVTLHPPLRCLGAMPLAVTFLRVVFQAWELYVAKTYIKALETENQRLQALVKKKTESIWNMKQADLVEVARSELGMSMAQAAKETTITLREKIRRNREIVKEVQDPMMVLPKGLQKMKHAELLLEMERRNLPIPEKATRPMMILMIREQVDFLSQTGATSQETSQATNGTTSEDWMTVDGVSVRETRSRR